MRHTLDEMVLVKKKQILGVCIGMQIMSESSEEGTELGLGWIKASVKKFKQSNDFITPHMGWNKVEPIKTNDLFQDIEDPEFYFLHSYYFDTLNTSVSAGITHYNKTFTSFIQKENIFGTQFHPEKSHSWGIKLLNNFANL